MQEKRSVKVLVKRIRTTFIFNVRAGNSNLAKSAKCSRNVLA